MQRKFGDRRIIFDKVKIAQICIGIDLGKIICQIWKIVKKIDARQTKTSQKANAFGWSKTVTTRLL